MSHGETNEESKQQQPLYIGRVKFYDRTRMFGFITYDVLSDAKKDQKDVFVHSSAIEPYNTHNCAPYLVKGEYVEFYVRDAHKGKIALGVRGVGDGPLMMDSGLENNNKRRKHNRSSSFVDTESDTNVVVVGEE